MNEAAKLTFKQEVRGEKESSAADAAVRDDINQENTAVVSGAGDVIDDDDYVNRFIDDEVVNDEDDDEEGAQFMPSTEMGGMPLRGGPIAGGMLGGVQMREKRLPLFKSATNPQGPIPSQPRMNKRQTSSAK